MRAKVTKEFTGRPDSEALPRTIAVGETITGDLAKVAVREGWAEAGGRSPSGQDDGKPALAAMTLAQLKAFAQEHKIDLGGASKKAAVLAAIETATSAQK